MEVNSSEVDSDDEKEFAPRDPVFPQLESLRLIMQLDLQDQVSRFAYVVLDLWEEIRSNPQNIDPQHCRETFRELLGAFDQPSSRSETFQLAKYALTAWVDDLLSRANWTEAAAWNRTPLEQEIFGTQNRRWQFFEQAETAFRQANWEALRVFQFCVEFGFRGIYAQERIKVQLTDPLPMARTRLETLAQSPILAGVMEGESQSSPQQEISESQAVAVTSDWTPLVLPPTLHEWSQTTFSPLGTRTSTETSSPNPVINGFLFPNRAATEWAIVAAIGLLISVVLFAIGK